VVDTLSVLDTGPGVLDTPVSVLDTPMPVSRSVRRQVPLRPCQKASGLRVRGSEAGSYLRRIDFVYHSTLGLRVIKKKKKARLGLLGRIREGGTGSALAELSHALRPHL